MNFSSQEELKEYLNSLGKKSKRFVGEIKEWATHGFPTISGEERYLICQKCDDFDQSKFNGTGQCKICGCAMAVKTKLASAKCPKGKWAQTS